MPAKISNYFSKQKYFKRCGGFFFFLGYENLQTDVCDSRSGASRGLGSGAHGCGHRSLG